MIEVVGVLVSAAEGEHARTQDVSDTVRHQQRIARVIDQRREPVGNADLLLDGTEQHHAAIGGETTAIEGGGDFLAQHRWQ